MPAPHLIYDLHGPLIDNHTMMETSLVHSIPTIYHKLEHSMRSSPLDISFYKMSAADMIRYHYHLHDPSSFTNEQYSLSSSQSGDLPTLAKPKKQSYKRLLREIRQLRSENTTLHNTVNILKEDLRHEQESREIAERCHRKFFDDSMDTHTRLNLEIMDQQDQLFAYQSRLDNTSNKNSSFDGSSDDLWGCEDMDCSNERQCYADTYSDFDMDIDDDDQQWHDDKDDPFEDLAISYLQQALISNLTSARANLELDDLVLKHDPSPVRVLRTLADAFLGWIRQTIHIATATPSATSCTTLSDEKSICVARLMTTQVQQVFLRFWKNILERHVHNDKDQYLFLQQAERTLHDQQNESYYITQNFHRLLVMLYKYDIVDADAVVEWWYDHSLDNGDGDNHDYHDATVADQLRQVTKNFVEWVNEEDDDDGDNEDLLTDELDGVVEEDDSDDGLYSGLLGTTPEDDSNISRTPIQPVERKKKSVTIQV